MIFTQWKNSILIMIIFITFGGFTPVLARGQEAPEKKKIDLFNIKIVPPEEIAEETLKEHLYQVGVPLELQPIQIVSKRKYAMMARAVATREDIEKVNIATAEDSVKYLPSVFPRRRFIGDPNSTTSIRGNSEFQTTRTMLFVDGFPLHTLLRTRFRGAPIWNLVAPDEIDSSEVIYGPFLSRYSGNAMGGVINLTTRQPQKREFVMQSSYFNQKFKLLGSSGDYDGFKTFISFSDKVGKLSYSGFFNHLDNDSHPLTFRSAIGSFSKGISETVVTGAFRNQDIRGRDQITFGSTGAERSIQNIFKMKLNYELTPDLTARVMVGFLDRDRNRISPENFLRDASGNKIFGDNNNKTADAQFNGEAFNVRNSNFGIERRDKEELLLGLGLDGELGAGWFFDGKLSYFHVPQDLRKQSDENPEDPLFDGSGRVTEFDDTGWETIDMRLAKRSFLIKNLDFELGYHYNHSSLETRQFNSSDFDKASKDSFRNANGGDTEINSGFFQLGWDFIPQWSLTFGGRQESWRSYNGFNKKGSDPGLQPDRSFSKFSPKGSLEFRPDDHWAFTFSLARAFRFPIVGELFENVQTQTSSTLANADLEPEDGFHKTFIIRRGDNQGSIQLSLFEDDVQNTIFNVLDAISVTSTLLNVDRVRTRGAELSVKQKNFLVPNFDLILNTTYLDSHVLTNSRNPSIEGKNFPRIPKWRLNFLGNYHLTPAWDASLGVRFASNSFGRLDNSDTLPGFGGISEFHVADFKTSYKFDNEATASFGIDNIADTTFFRFHPFPQRTYFVDLKWTFG